MAKGISNTSRTSERDDQGRFVFGSKGHCVTHSSESKKKMSEGHLGRRCSPKTEFKIGQIPWNKGLKGAQKPYWLSKRRPGMTKDGNPSWKGGITALQKKIRNSPEMRRWRGDIFKRDNRKCVLCDSGKQIQADHLYPFSRMLEDGNIQTLEEAINCKGFWDIQNGRTLCFDCHKKVKNEGGYRMAGKTPTQRTMEYVMNQGWEGSICERWIPNPKHPGGGFRKDMFGFADIVAMGEGKIIAIQSCGQAYAEHDRKITQEVAEPALKWLECGGRLILIAWRKVKLKRGGKAERWQPRIKEYGREDFTVS